MVLGCEVEWCETGMRVVFTEPSFSDIFFRNTLIATGIYKIDIKCKFHITACNYHDASSGCSNALTRNYPFLG